MLLPEIKAKSGGGGVRIRGLKKGEREEPGEGGVPGVLGRVWGWGSGVEGRWADAGFSLFPFPSPPLPPQGTFSLIIQAWHAPANYLPEGDYGRPPPAGGAPALARERGGSAPRAPCSPVPVPPPPLTPPIPKRLTAALASAVYTITPPPALSHRQETVPSPLNDSHRGAALILPRA